MLESLVRSALCGGRNNVPAQAGCLGAALARPVNSFNVGAYPGENAAAQAALVDAAAWEGYAIGLEVAQAGCDRKPAEK